jgi:HTH-like domain
MSAHQALYPIRTMARVLKVSASGYYAWRSRPASARATADADLTRHIRTIHAGSHGTYGAPRVHAELKADGLSVGRKRIARLMRAAGITGVSRRRSTPVTTRQATDHHPASDLVRRNFTAERPNAFGCRHHLPADVGRLSLPRGRSRRLVAPDRRMGLLGRPEDPRRARRSRHGDRGPKARQRRPSFGSRFAIYVGRFRRSLQGSRRSSIDRLGRRRLRQCAVREFLRHPRMRADRSASLSISQRGADGRLSVHRRLLQSLTPPLGPGLSFAHRIRKETR